MRRRRGRVQLRLVHVGRTRRAEQPRRRVVGPRCAPAARARRRRLQRHGLAARARPAASSGEMLSRSRGPPGSGGRSVHRDGDRDLLAGHERLGLGVRAPVAEVELPRVTSSEPPSGATSQSRARPAPAAGRTPARAAPPRSRAAPGPRRAVAESKHERAAVVGALVERQVGRLAVRAPGARRCRGLQRPAGAPRAARRAARPERGTSAPRRAATATRAR